MWQWHAEAAALTVWLQRHASAAQLRHALAEWEYFGRDAHGFRAATLAYFGVPPERLTVGQIALLAGLPIAPTAYEPVCHPARAIERRAYILSLMLAAGLISDAQAKEARVEPLSVLPPEHACPDVDPQRPSVE
jgi:penicillin-binding protein 1A